MVLLELEEVVVLQMSPIYWRLNRRTLAPSQKHQTNQPLVFSLTGQHLAERRKKFVFTTNKLRESVSHIHIFIRVNKANPYFLYW